MAELSPGLLPEGLRDRLPPQAEAAAHIASLIGVTLRSRGYDYVMPPLAEFEGNLLSRLKQGGGRDLLRFTDPVSQRTLALRPDITAQIGRIATTRMEHLPRPLRLSYGGPVLRFRGSQLDPSREALQTGAELIGSDAVPAVIEVLNVALEAIEGIGDRRLDRLTVDITLPDLVQSLAGGPLPAEGEALEALSRSLEAKDAGATRGSGYEALLAATGPADAALKQLRAMQVDGFLDARLDALAEVIAAIRAQADLIGADVAVTLDPTERHGFEFQSWIGFSIFAEGVPTQIARGGAYTLVHPDGFEEAAVGFSLFVDPLVDAGIGMIEEKRCFLPLDTPRVVLRELARHGWRVIPALSAEDDAAALRCTHIWNGKRPEPLGR